MMRKGEGAQDNVASIKGNYDAQRIISTVRSHLCPTIWRADLTNEEDLATGAGAYRASEQGALHDWIRLRFASQHESDMKRWTRSGARQML